MRTLYRYMIKVNKDLYDLTNITQKSILDELYNQVLMAVQEKEPIMTLEWVKNQSHIRAINPFTENGARYMDEDNFPVDYWEMHYLRDRGWISYEIKFEYTHK